MPVGSEGVVECTECGIVFWATTVKQPALKRALKGFLFNQRNLRLPAIALALSALCWFMLLYLLQGVSFAVEIVFVAALSSCYVLWRINKSLLYDKGNLLRIPLANTCDFFGLMATGIRRIAFIPLIKANLRF